MPALSGIPPGRAGRNWLRRRLATAERGRGSWTGSCASSSRRSSGCGSWPRAPAQTGRRPARRPMPGCCARPCSVDRTPSAAPAGSSPSASRSSGRPPWGDVSVRGPRHRGDRDRGAPSRQLRRRTGYHTAFHAALVAGVRTARPRRRCAASRQRSPSPADGCALDRRWLPRLQGELIRLELTLEQSEQEDGLRLRRAAASASRGRALP